MHSDEVQDIGMISNLLILRTCGEDLCTSDKSRGHVRILQAFDRAVLRSMFSQDG